MKKLATIRTQLTRWSRRVFGRAEDRIAKCIKSLLAIQEAMKCDPLSYGLLQAEANYRRQLSDLYWQEESTARQQSRIRWLRDGDANTAFFHASIKARHARNTIQNLEVDGRLINDPLSIGRLSTINTVCSSINTKARVAFHRAFSGCPSRRRRIDAFAPWQLWTSSERWCEN